MAIEFQCPECRKPFSARDEYSGKKAKCPCGTRLVVPIATKPQIVKKSIPTARPLRQKGGDQIENCEREHRTEVRDTTSLQFSEMQSELPPQKMNERNKGKSITFKGRIGRAKFVLSAFCLIPLLSCVIGFIYQVLVFILVLAINCESLLFEFILKLFVVLLIAYFLINHVWYLIIFWRRLHDMVKYGWHFLLLFAPIISVVIFALMLVRKGTEGSNRYGPSPS